MMRKEIIKKTDGHFNSLSLIIKSKRVPQTEESGGVIFDIPSQVTVKWKIIFHFNAYFMSRISISTSRVSELCCVGMFLTKCRKYVKDVNVNKQIQKHWECVHISLFTIIETIVSLGMCFISILMIKSFHLWSALNRNSALFTSCFKSYMYLCFVTFCI